MSDDDAKALSTRDEWIDAARPGIDDEEEQLHREGVSLRQYRRIGDPSFDDFSEEDRADVTSRLEAGRSEIEAGRGIVLDDAYLSCLKDRALSRR